jgi:hypothetical protein
MFSSEQWLANSGANFYNGVATQSLRFDDGRNTELTRSPAGATDQKKYTLSCWVKRANLGSDQTIFSAGNSGSGNPGFEQLNFTSGNALRYYRQIGSVGNTEYITTQLFRDTSAWYNIVVMMDAANTIGYIYVNGVRVTSFSTTNHPTNVDGAVNSTQKHAFGNRSIDGSSDFDGYLAEVNFLDGLIVGETSGYLDQFGELKNGVWIPKAYSGSYGTNGYRLDFADNAVDAPTSEGTEDTDNIGSDSSGEHNNFTSSGIVASDCSIIDSPENNFATLNPLYATAQAVFAEGNLKVNFTDGTFNSAGSTISTGSMKFYAEVLISASNVTNAEAVIGVVDADKFGWNSDNYNPSTGSNGVGYFCNNGAISNGYGTDGSGATLGVGDILGIACDGVAGSVEFYKNGSSQGSVTVTAGLAYNVAMTDTSRFTNNATFVCNFGQDSSFAGNKTSGSENAQDANGIGDFYDVVPSGGYLALCTANLPEPTIGANSLTQADDHFNTVLYTSDNIGANGTQNVTGVGFKPDWVWLKNRTSDSTSHTLYDSNRGTGRHNSPDSNTSEVGLNSAFGYLGTFGNDGYTLRGGSTNANYVNQSTNAYASWNWKSNGGITSPLTDGSINTTVQVNATAGFSIMTFVSDNQNGTTLAHGLGVAPAWFIIKDRDEDNAFYHYHKGLGSGKFTSWGAGSLGTGAPEASTTVWGNTDPTSTLITVGIGNMSFDNGHNIVAYAFAEVESYSRFGTYTGNGLADGTFVYTGFRPAFLMIKRTDTASPWVIFDNKRDGFNVNNDQLVANATTAEADGASNTFLDILSNGFKLRNTANDKNASGGTYIYMAFGDSTKYANAR